MFDKDISRIRFGNDAAAKPPRRFQREEKVGQDNIAYRGFKQIRMLKIRFLKLGFSLLISSDFPLSFLHLSSKFPPNVLQNSSKYPPNIPQQFPELGHATLFFFKKTCTRVRAKQCFLVFYCLLFCFVVLCFFGFFVLYKKILEKLNKTKKT